MFLTHKSQFVMVGMLKGGTILITGCLGLIGTGLRCALLSQGFIVRGLDIRGQGSDYGDVRDYEAVKRTINRCTGVIHLAAVSRVIDGEKDPEKCWDINVNGITNILKGIAAQEHKPWQIFASSREVYGNAAELPVKDDAPRAPINIYDESKVRSEILIEEAMVQEGLLAAILRFSNILGGVNDHTDRVIPAFVRAALQDNSLRVDGDDNTFDFTYLPDVIKGIQLTMHYIISRKESLRPMHFVTGRPTTLRELADITIRILGSKSTILRAPARDYDVARFYGCTDRARRVLGWEHKISLETGLLRLAELIPVPSGLIPTE